jgi:hypothetical protein
MRKPKNRRKIISNALLVTWPAPGELEHETVL